MTDVRVAACLRANNEHFKYTLKSIETLHENVDAIHVQGNISVDNEAALKHLGVNYYHYEGKDVIDEMNKLLSRAPSSRWLLSFDSNEVPTEDLSMFVATLRDNYKTKDYDSIWFRECESLNGHVSQPEFRFVPKLFVNVRNPYIIKDGNVVMRDGMFRRIAKSHKIYVRHVGGV